MGTAAVKSSNTPAATTSSNDLDNNSNGNIYSTRGEVVVGTDTERERRDAKLEKMIGRDRTNSSDSTSDRDWRDAESRDVNGNSSSRRTRKNSRDMSTTSDGG